MIRFRKWLVLQLVDICLKAVRYKPRLTLLTYFYTRKINNSSHFLFLSRFRFAPQPQKGSIPTASVTSCGSWSGRRAWPPSTRASLPSCCEHSPLTLWVQFSFSRRIVAPSWGAKMSQSWKASGSNRSKTPLHHFTFIKADKRPSEVKTSLLQGDLVTSGPQRPQNTHNNENQEVNMKKKVQLFFVAEVLKWQL